MANDVDRHPGASSPGRKRGTGTAGGRVLETVLARLTPSLRVLRTVPGDATRVLLLWPVGYLLVVLTGVAFVMLDRLDSALQQMHIESGTSGSAEAFPLSFNDLGGSILRGPAQDAVSTINASWGEYDGQVAGNSVLAKAGLVAGRVVMLDMTFAVLYTLLLTLVVVALYRANDAAGPGNVQRARYRRMLQWTGGGVALLFVTDVAENAQVAYHIIGNHPLWSIGPVALGPATTLLKLVLVVAVLVPILAVAVAGLLDTPEIVRTLLTTRAVGLAVAVLAVLLFVGIGAAQVDDVVRAWNPVAAWIALAAAAGLAVVVTGVSRDLSGPRAEGLAPDDGASSQWLLLGGGLGLLGLGQVLQILGLGWGLSVPGGMLLVIWLLGLLMSGPADSSSPAEYGSSKYGSSEHGSSEHGPSEHGASEHGPSEHGASENRQAENGPAGIGPVENGSAGSGPAGSGPATGAPLGGCAPSAEETATAQDAAAAQVSVWGDRLARALGGAVLAMFVWVIARAIALDLFARRPGRPEVDLLAGRPQGSEVDLRLILGMAALAAAIGAVLVAWQRVPEAPVIGTPMPSWPVLRRLWFWITVVATGGFVALSFDGLTVTWAARAGTVAIVLGGVGLLIGLAGLAAGVVRQHSGQYALPPAFRALRLKRFPVVVSLVAWILVVSAVDQGGFHDIRRHRGAASAEPPTLASAWAAWAAAAGPSGVGKTHPVVLVAAEGGGIRAAVWTALVLECLFGPGPVGDSGDVCRAGHGEPDVKALAASVLPPTPIFLASGASGGSLGIAAWSARRADLVQDQAGAGTPRVIEQALTHDFVAPDAGRLFTVDLPHTLLVWNRADRAAMLERAWQSAWPGSGGDDTGRDARGLNRGLRTLWDVTHEAGAPWATPVLALNGVTVEDGCRFVASAVDFTLPRTVPDDLTSLSGKPTAEDDRPDDAACRGPATDAEAGGGEAVDALPSTSELIDYLCAGEDVPLSTAAHLSARFPYVSPTGRVARTGCADAPGSMPDGSVSFDADGGIFDNSGAGTVADSWRALSPLVAAQERQDGTCFPPIFIQIDNSPPESTKSAEPDARPAELLAPVGATLGQVGSRESYARARAAAAFDRPVSPSGLIVRRSDGGSPQLWFRISLFGQPGPQPPLGWTLAPQTVSDMRAQLRLTNNAEAIDQIRGLLDAGLTCAAPPGSQP